MGEIWNLYLETKKDKSEVELTFLLYVAGISALQNCTKK